MDSCAETEVEGGGGGLVAQIGLGPVPTCNGGDTQQVMVNALGYSCDKLGSKAVVIYQASEVVFCIIEGWIFYIV